MIAQMDRWVDGWDGVVMEIYGVGWRLKGAPKWTLVGWMSHPHLCPLPLRLPMERAKFRISNQNTILVTYSRSWRILWGRWDGRKWHLQETPWISWRPFPQLPWHERQLNLIPGAMSWPKALKQRVGSWGEAPIQMTTGIPLPGSTQVQQRLNWQLK